MAQPRTRLLIAGLALLAGGAGLGLGLPAADSGPAVPASDAPPPADDPGADAPPPENAAAQALADDPAVRGYQARLQFAADYRAFLQGAAGLAEHERQRQAEALAREIDRREAARELALSEALLLQLGLVQALGGDEDSQKARADALLARYQALGKAREAGAQTPDARFSRYKSEEKRIVEEVMALQSIPDGLSRDQYLRQRLQEAREQAYQ
ncbi:hypothetical protein AAFN46_19045 [Pseudomonas sp. CAU 1711]|uniref:hypothetical protein n=1 Tax=Pseudomonas sp. CAU 1711 TaxID=3140356 RepID=UPI0032602E5A